MDPASTWPSQQGCILAVVFTLGIPLASIICIVLHFRIVFGSRSGSAMIWAIILSLALGGFALYCLIGTGFGPIRGIWKIFIGMPLVAGGLLPFSLLGYWLSLRR
jgi:hypothetical protein